MLDRSTVDSRSAEGAGYTVEIKLIENVES